MASLFANAHDNYREGGEHHNLQRQPYGVGIGADYSNYKSELLHMMQLITADSTADPRNDGTAKGDDGKDILDGAEQTCKYQFEAPTVSDSSIFGNDVINPYAGFCRDDDIVHASFFKSQNGADPTIQEGAVGINHTYGMGRVYQEIYDSKQQPMYMQFGVPKYRNLRAFLMNAVDSDMADLNEQAEPGIVSKLGSLISGGVILAIKLPWLPFEWGVKAIQGLGETSITEYFYFKETMMLYFRYVNTIMAHIAVGMGLYATDEGISNSMPSILQGGPDIFKILSSRSRRFSAGISNTDKTTDDLLKQTLQTNPDTEGDSVWKTIGEWWDNFWGKIYEGAKTSVLDGNKFIAFRIEKGSDNASESFSNTIQESSLQQRLNGEVTQARERNLGMVAQSNDWFSSIATLVNKAKVGYNKAKALVVGQEGAAPGLIAYMAAGNGYFDLPKQWAGSSFSRSFNVNIRLRSKTGGDPVSIYTNIMIPLACLLAGAMPRQSGDGTYTSPFIVRAWCRGMFALPAGIIQSLSVSRGDSEFGWTVNRQPTTVSVSMTFEDLSPILFLGLAGDGAWKQAFTNNTKLQEYLNTLTGIGLKQRYYMFAQLKRNAKVWALLHKNTTLSATYWGMRVGESAVGRIISSFTPVKYMRTASN